MAVHIQGVSLDQFHAVDIRHPFRSIIQANQVVPLLQSHLHRLPGRLIPTSGIQCQLLAFAAIHAQVQLPFLTADVSQRQFIFSAFFAVHVPPLQVVLLASSQPTGLRAAGTIICFLIYSGLRHLIVRQFLVSVQPGRFPLVLHPFITFLGLQLINPRAMGRKLHRHVSFEVPQIFFHEQVTDTDLATQLQIEEIHRKSHRAVGRVIKSHGALRTVKRFHILHQHVSTVFPFHHICLQGQRVLVQGYEFLVRQQVKGRL